jgi:hypothetical protein
MTDTLIISTDYMANYIQNGTACSLDIEKIGYNGIQKHDFLYSTSISKRGTIHHNSDKSLIHINIIAKLFPGKDYTCICLESCAFSIFLYTFFSFVQKG